MLGGLAEQPQGHVMELQDEARLRAMLCAVVDWVVLLPSALTRTNQPLRGIGATWFGLQEDPEGDAVLINGGGEEDSRKRDKEQEDDDKRDIEQRRKRYEAYEQWIHGTLRPTLDWGDGQLLSTTILRLWSESSYLSPHLVFQQEKKFFYFNIFLFLYCRIDSCPRFWRTKSDRLSSTWCPGSTRCGTRSWALNRC